MNEVAVTRLKSLKKKKKGPTIPDSELEAQVTVAPPNKEAEGIQPH